jgi:hypothetical protein
MKQSMAVKLGMILMGVALVAAPGANAVAEDSGFLKDYSQLEVKKDPKGVERRVWFSDKLTSQNYKQILIDPVSFYPEAQPSEQVTLGALNDIRDYIDSGLRKAIGGTMPLGKTAGAGVAKLRVAITAFSVDKSLKPYQMIPIAFIFTSVDRASGSAKYDVKLYVEAELADSVTGEVLGRAVREAKGVEVTGDQPLTLKEAKPTIDGWLSAVQQVVAEKLGAGK